MKIGIIVAMDKEMQQLQHLFNDGDVIVKKCGIGKVNAALGAAEMIDQHHPDVIISSGCAGGNGDDVNIQDVVVSTELVYHDVYCGEAIGHSVYGQVQGLPERFKADPMLLDKASHFSPLSSQSTFIQDLLPLATGLWTQRIRCARLSGTSLKPKPSIWSRQPSPRPAICAMCHSSRSASSATFPCVTPMLHSITTSGIPLPSTPFRSLRPLSSRLNAKFVQHGYQTLVEALVSTDALAEGHIHHFVVSDTYHDVALTLLNGFNSTDTRTACQYAVAS